MIKDKTNSTMGKIKALSLIVVIISLGLLLWIFYSFYSFYSQYNKSLKNISSDSYIDKQGLEQVKLKLEQRQ